MFIVLNKTSLYGDAAADRPESEESPFIDQINASVYSGWDSHYFTEGRDLLDGGSLIIHDLQASRDFLFSQIWYAASPDQSYDELQFLGGVTHSVNDLTVYAAYRNLQFPSDDLDDDEAAVGISTVGLPAGLQLAVDAYHSFEADGFFTLISVSKGFTLADSLGVTATGEFGMNQGYVSDGHDGANHVALSLVSTYQIHKSVSLIVRLTQSWAIDEEARAPGDETLVDFFNGGIGIQWSL